MCTVSFLGAVVQQLARWEWFNILTTGGGPPAQVLEMLLKLNDRDTQRYASEARLQALKLHLAFF